MEVLARYDDAASALLDAYRTGTPQAMERHHRLTWHRRTWSVMRTYVQLDLGRQPIDADDPMEITLDDARYLVAIEHGFGDWAELASFAKSPGSSTALAAKPVHLTTDGPREASRTLASSRDWNEIVAALARHPSAVLHAHGQMTDAVLLQISRLHELEALDLGGSRQVTDDGVQHLAALPRLRRLNLSGTAVTDRGLTVLRQLPLLEELSLNGTRVTDTGIALMMHCQELRRVELAGTATGDGAIRALAGKTRLTHFTSGNNLTNDGLRLLHEWPVFSTWQGGEEEMALTSYSAAPNELVLRGAFTDDGVRHLQGLDGLFALNLDDRALAITADAMIPLRSLPHLGWLAVDARDDWMPHIAALPALRFLGIQDTSAGDDGFVALSASRSIEQIWGRRCHNLRTRGFTALANMPRLRNLSVSCLNVEDAGVATLPSFPALRELMPMDIPDAGYRHIARCEQLESLVLMYCRDTTDTATEHIVRLPKLARYFNSYTTITDRTPELLSSMDSLEEITFDSCHRLTDAGIAQLARLPRLRRLQVAGHGVTTGVAARFPSTVSVRVNG